MCRTEVFFQNQHACQNTENCGMLPGKGLGRYWDATGMLLCEAVLHQAGRGHENQDSRRPLPWARSQRFRFRLPGARGGRFLWPVTVGTRATISVALYRGPEAEDCRRPLPWARGRRFPTSSTVGPSLRIPVAFYRGTKLMVPGRFTVVARPEIPVRHGARRE